MCEFETPSFVYYSHIAVIILSLITGILILARNPKHPINRNAFYFILVLVLWIIDDIFQWTLHSVYWNMFAAKISYMADFAVLFFLYFAYHFTYTKINFKKKIVLAIPYIILAILGYTKYAFDFFDPNTCDYISGSLIYYLFSLDIIYAFWATRILLGYSRNPITPMIQKKQVKLLISAIWFFVVWSMIYEGIGKFNFPVDITPHFVVGNLFFISLIAFAIIKRDLFGFKNVLLDWFTIFLWSIVFAIFFIFSTSPFAIIMFAIAYILLLVIFWKM